MQKIIKVSEELFNFLAENKRDLSVDDYIRERVGLPLQYNNFNFKYLKFGDSRTYEIKTEKFRAKIFRAIDVAKLKGIKLQTEVIDHETLKVTRVDDLI